MQQFVLEFRMYPTGGPVVKGYLSSGSWHSLATARHVIFMVHGYNVNRSRGESGLGNLASKLSFASAEVAVVSILWPGDSSIGAIGYPFEGQDADDTAHYFSSFIADTFARGTHLDFVSHSLGARVVLETIRRLPAARYNIKNVCLMAAAIDDVSLAEPLIYEDAARRSGRIAVLASHNDTVLKLAYPLGDFFQSFLYSREEYGMAMGLDGAKGSADNNLAENVLNFQIPDAAGVGHGDYIPDDSPNTNQLTAARFCDDLLHGFPTLQYR